MQRSRAQLRRPAGLIILATASALTSFARERFLLQEALGHADLDHAVSVYAVAALLGNLVATVLALLWIDGRTLPRFIRHTEWVLVVGLLVVPVMPIAGWAIMLGGAVVTYDFARQRAAFGAGQLTSMIAALVSPVFTVAYWHSFGIDSIGHILGGYAVGFVFQAAGATWSSRHSAERTPTAPVGAGVSVLWPIVFAALTQANGLLDRLFLSWSGDGWTAASAFALNTSGTLMLVVVSPLSSEAVAGRLQAQPSRRMIGAVTGLVVAGTIITPLLLPLLIKGGLVEGDSYERVRNLFMLYLLAAPGAGYWLYRARALQSTSSTWRLVTQSGLAMLAVHVVLAVIGVAIGQPYLVAGSYLLGSYLGAYLLTERSIARSRRDGAAPVLVLAGTPGVTAES